jgi:8-oxo-dGTP pyrophosphatase MutT (NUDIX family)
MQRFANVNTRDLTTANEPAPTETGAAPFLKWVGGKVDPEDGDNPEVAIIREAREETGLNISNLRLIHAGLYRGDQQYAYLADW